MKIYIAGAITGIFDFLKIFAEAEADLKAKGHIVLNPSFLPDGLKDYMQICKAMIDQADAIYMLNGHEASVGATEELQYAKEKKKKIFFENNYSQTIRTNHNNQIIHIIHAEKKKTPLWAKF